MWLIEVGGGAKSANEQQNTPSINACSMKTDSVLFRTFQQTHK
jgi:hypothetical protein